MSDNDRDGTAGVDPEAETAPPTKPELPDTTDENGRPVDNPSG